MSRRHRADKREINPDPKFVRIAVEGLLDQLRDGQHVVLRSTVYPRVTAMVEKLIAGSGLESTSPRFWYVSVGSPPSGLRFACESVRKTITAGGLLCIGTFSCGPILTRSTRT